jgi:uncharacterized protein (DUF1499 family)
MVDVKMGMDDNAKITYKVTTPKTKVDYLVSKTMNGYNSYNITSTQGRIPDALSGIYTTPDKALEALVKYLKAIPETKTVQRDNYFREKKLKHASDLQSNS